nr:reverse transcriptase domain-containing protein [Tanacetum cinerariifolium]
MFKKLLNNKDKLIELTKTSPNENCSAVVLKKLPEKLGERKPRKGQNRIKTGQKREACRSQEKFKAVAVIHISIVRCGVGLKFALRNRVLLWKCLKIRVLRWTVLIESSLVGWTVLIEIIALKTILVVVWLSRLMKSRWSHLIKNVLTVLNEISDCCGLKLLDVIVEYGKIISSSRMHLSAEDQKSLSEKKKEEEHLRLSSHQ